MPRFETERLLVRPFERSDRSDVAALLDACFGTAEATRRDRWLEWTVRSYAAHAELMQPPYGDLAVVRKRDARLVATVGLVPCLAPFDRLPYFRDRLGHVDRGRFTPEVGLYWATAPAHRGRGVASEAAAALMRRVFDDMHVDRVVACTDRDNAPSIAVMRRIGMTIDRNPSSEPWWFQVVGVRSAVDDRGPT